MTPRVTATWRVSRGHRQQHRSHARVSTVYSWTQIKSLPQQRTRTRWRGDTKPLSRRGPWTPGHHSGWGGGTHRDPSPFPGVTCQAGTRTRQPQGDETHTDMPGITPTQPTQTRPETPNHTHRHARRQKHNLGWGPAACRAGDSHSGREAETRRDGDGDARASRRGGDAAASGRSQDCSPPSLLSSLSASPGPLLWLLLSLPLWKPLGSSLSPSPAVFLASVFLCFLSPSVSSGSLSRSTSDCAFVWFRFSLSLCFFVSLCLSASLSLHPTAF